MAAPTADLNLTMVGTPNPVLLGTNIIYTLTISNAGPATATAVGLTNTLPPLANASLVSASPATYLRNGAVVTFTNLGSLPAGQPTQLLLGLSDLPLSGRRQLPPGAVLIERAA